MKELDDLKAADGDFLVVFVLTESVGGVDVVLNGENTFYTRD